jgi:hypothetical protein
MLTSDIFLIAHINLPWKCFIKGRIKGKRPGFLNPVTKESDGPLFGVPAQG